MVCGVAIGMGCARVDGVVVTAAEGVVVPVGVRGPDVVAVVVTADDVRLVVVVGVVLEDVKSVVVVVGVELPAVVVTTEFVVVTTEFVVVTGARVVVAVVVAVTGSATAGTAPRPSAVSETASPNVSTTAAP
jgi:hypothetical protein